MYLQFCNGIGVRPVTISLANLGRYIAFLASHLCFSSVRQYLNAVCHLHLEAGLPNPLTNNWYITSILKGRQHHKGDSTLQKLPITTEILFGIFVTPACSRVQFWRPIFHLSVHLSTFMSKFDIYVKVSIPIKYKTKQPSNLA